MDKLKKVLSGQDGNDDLNVLQVIEVSCVWQFDVTASRYSMR